MEDQNVWRKCSTCKKNILFNQNYYECSVSTCTGLRTGYVFCCLSCWEVHLPGAKHRQAGAIEKRSPTQAEFAKLDSSPKRIIVGSASSAVMNSSSQSQTASVVASTASRSSSMSHEVLVVVSKMKQYIREMSEMNTSEDVNQMLSQMIRQACDQAILRARADGRKTVMARDFK